MAGSFPNETRHVLETLKGVYRNDAAARERNLSPQERLHFHREHSRAAMIELRMWFRTELREKRIEPNLFEYLTELQRHAPAVDANSAAWMPWNYQAALKAQGMTSPSGNALS